MLIKNYSLNKLHYGITRLFLASTLVILCCSEQESFEAYQDIKIDHLHQFIENPTQILMPNQSPNRLSLRVLSSKLKPIEISQIPSQTTHLSIEYVNVDASNIYNIIRKLEVPDQIDKLELIGIHGKGHTDTETKERNITNDNLSDLSLGNMSKFKFSSSALNMKKMEEIRMVNVPLDEKLNLKDLNKLRRLALSYSSCNRLSLSESIEFISLQNIAYFRLDNLTGGTKAKELIFVNNGYWSFNDIQRFTSLERLEVSTLNNYALSAHKSVEISLKSLKLHIIDENENYLYILSQINSNLSELAISFNTQEADRNFKWESILKFRDTLNTLTIENSISLNYDDLMFIIKSLPNLKSIRIINALNLENLRALENSQIEKFYIEGSHSLESLPDWETMEFLNELSLLINTEDIDQTPILPKIDKVTATEKKDNTSLIITYEKISKGLSNSSIEITGVSIDIGRIDAAFFKQTPNLRSLRLINTKIHGDLNLKDMSSLETLELRSIKGQKIHLPKSLETFIFDAYNPE